MLRPMAELRMDTVGLASKANGGSLRPSTVTVTTGSARPARFCPLAVVSAEPTLWLPTKMCVTVPEPVLKLNTVDAVMGDGDVKVYQR